MKRPSLLPAVLAAILAAASTHAAPTVVINEIHYHPANDDDRLQYIELHNPGQAEVDLSGWKLRGAKFDFPAQTKISPGAYLVVARDLRALQSIHGSGFPAIGNFGGRLKRSGEKIDLVDASNQVVESVRFSDKAPWPLAPDGFANTLERISPAAPAGDPHNWAPSRRASRNGHEGTPGRANDNASAHPLPVVDQVKWEKLPALGTDLPVSANISASADNTEAQLVYTTFKAGGSTSTNRIPLKRTSGTARAGSYEAAIPAPAPDTLVRFVIRASAGEGAERIHPHPAEARPAFSSYVFTAPNAGRIPIVTILNPVRIRAGVNQFQPAREDLPEVGHSAFIHVTPAGKTELFDFVSVRHREGGWKVHFLKDQLLDGMSGLNLISEGPPRWMLAEHLSYELYRRAGLRIQNSGHYRLTVDGRPLGYILYVEQPNKTFLERSGRNNDGNLYKIRWFEQDPVRAHEKKTNPTSGHDVLMTLLAGLNSNSGEAQWKFIQQHFNLTNVINYFAVNMCIQNWDGFFNNYYAYHNTDAGGKWEIIPWDEDKTWGEYDGASANYDWYEMPLTIGMIGDGPPRAISSRGPFGGASWWRPPGFFSGPLLANPQFRAAFLARLRELCDTVFTEERFFPAIQALHNELRPEVEAQARARGQEPESALRQFDEMIDSFRRQLTNRRKFILKEL